MINTRIFSSHFDPPLDSDYLCPICHELLNEPIQTVPCGHNFCSKCYDTWKNKSLLCPNCQTQPQSIFPDGRVSRIIAGKRIICPNKDNQKPIDQTCKWTGAISDADAHLGKDCDYEMVCCRQCNKVKVLRKDLKKHLTDDCMDREVKCKHCGEVFKYSSGHIILCCPKVPVSCPNSGCKKRPARENMDEHLKECPFEPLSCTICFETILRMDMESHMQSALVKHQLSLLQKIQHMETILSEFTMPVWFIKSGKFVSVQSSSCYDWEKYNSNKVYNETTSPNRIIIDLHSEVLPIRYMFVSASLLSSMRNWNFLGSKDKNEWTLLKKHTHDPTFKKPWQIGVWYLESTSKFRYFCMTSDESMYVYNFDVCVLEKI